MKESSIITSVGIMKPAKLKLEGKFQGMNTFARHYQHAQIVFTRTLEKEDFHSSPYVYRCTAIWWWYVESLPTLFSKILTSAY